MRLTTRGKKRHSEEADWLSLASLGFFFVLLGVIWIITPDCLNEVAAFFKSFHLENVTEGMLLPAPGLNHSVVYTAAMQFCLAFGAFQIVILALRFILRESVDRKSGTLSGIVFWLGAGFFLNMLVAGEIGWFGFVAGLIIVIGLLIIVGSIVRLLFKSE